MVYLDFAKAFDKVDFGITLEKLHELGVGGKVGKWITSFLSDRVQSVIVEGVPSNNAPVKSGVPQGSVIGPILFLIMMGDIDKTVKDSFVSSFADDTRVGHKVSSTSDEADLQEDLNRIYLFADMNNMKFNTDKFEFVRYKQANDIAASPVYVTCDGKSIAEKSSVRDLGVTMSNDGRFSDHINKVRETACKVTSWILRTFRSREKHLMLTLWKSLVQPHLDYCCQLWSPKLLGDIAILEQVQKSFISKIKGYEHLNYHEKLRKFGLYSLERRRERYSIIYTWRMIESHVPNIGIQTSVSMRRGRMCKIPSYRTSAPNWVKNLKEASFCVRGPRLFNCLPKEIRDISSVHIDVFKAALDSWLSDIPDEPHVPGYTGLRRADTNSIKDMWSMKAANHGHLGQ